MIKIEKVLDNLIKEIIYTYEDKNWKIPIKSFCVKNSDDSNVGKIFEQYRNLQLNDNKAARKYLKNNIELIHRFIADTVQVNENNKPDYVQIFYPIDKLRRSIIEKFATKILSKDEKEVKANYSSSFYKKKKISSKLMQNSDNLFEYVRPHNLSSPVKNVWLIDDTMDTGNTINAFLNELMKNNLIDEKTSICGFKLFNNRKRDTMYKSIDGLNLQEIWDKLHGND